MSKKRKRKQTKTILQETSVDIWQQYIKQIFLKIFLLLLVVFIIGLPINTIFNFSLLVFIIVILITTSIQTGINKWLYALIGVIILRGMIWFIPSIEIQEGHNYFTYVAKNEILEQGLPSTVFQFGKEMLQAQYKKTGKNCSDKKYCWGDNKYPNKKYPGPKTVYAFSADSIWQTPKYSRIVDEIDFENQNEQRIGAFNTSSLNWVDWFRDAKKRAIIPRSRIPKFILYEFDKNAIGGSFCWQGYVAWQQKGEKYQRLFNKEKKCKTLTKRDIGKKIYAFSIIHSQQLKINFKPPSTILFWQKIEKVLKVLIVGMLMFLLIKIKWQKREDYIKPLFLLSLSLILAYVLNYWDDRSELIFRIQQAGNDGLTYISFAREMLQLLLQGDIVGFLRGHIDIFYYMPGLRYFRAVEMMIFGATNFGYILILFFFVLFIWKILNTLLNQKMARLLLAIFVLTPWLEVFGFALGFYETIMLAGFPGTAAYTFLLMGLYLVFAYFDKPEKFVYFSFWAGLSLALAVFIRPNLALMLSIFLLGIFLLLIYKKRFQEMFILGLGFSFILLVPLHNIYFGSKFVTLTSAAFISANFITPPSIYLQAFSDFLSGETTQVTQHTLYRWHWWVESKYQFLPFKEMFTAGTKSFLHILSIVVIMVGLLYQKIKVSPQIRFLIAGLLVQHISMFMWRPSYRYSAIVWLLTFIISLVVVYKGFFILKNKK
jgi:hypothetical protein